MEHIDKNTFKQIFRDHWEDFKAAWPRYDTNYYDTVVQKMLDCGDPEKMGFVQYRCTYCGETRRIAFTCKSCFCLSCAKPYTDRWVEFIGRRLLPGITYRHIILTVPMFLRKWFFRDPTLLSPFMQAGHACLLDVFKTCAGIDLDIGSVIVLQTAGRPANYNPHLHILATGGGLDPTDRWRKVSYIPFDMIHRKWQYHLLTMLRENVSDPAVEKEIDLAWRQYPKGFVAFVQNGQVPPGGRGLAQYLAKYVVSPPISVRRIERYDGHSVSYWYRDHTSGVIQHNTLPVLRFIGRMVQHILPKGFQRIRYYGFHCNIRYAAMRRKIAQIVPNNEPPDPLGFHVLPRKPFVQLFFETFDRDPLICTRCGNKMDLELVYHPDYGIIRDFWDTLFMEVPDEPTATSRLGMDRTSVDMPKQVVQVPLPFM